MVLLRSENLSGICAKLRTVAASNNRVHMPWSLSVYARHYVKSFTSLVSPEITRHDHSFIACSRHIYVWCCSSRTPRSWWITQSTQHHRRGCNSAVTRMWRSCRVQPSHKERAIGVVGCKRRGCCCNLSGGVALIVWFTTNGMCAKNKNICAWREQAIVREIAPHDLYCCLLQQCEDFRTCRSGFPIATLL